ncbi:MAG: UDP-N-acetylmuramoyl-L-alanyl-D-glutamate--2,6-diaminopimelate ligase [Rhodocyclaceae bacterium]|nr:UDP-N-acetylmuramoyl-L-alanyl-D-glutamate--2,6-diaminopimelate ligase [Rhodocyclaceae bacterium]MBP6109488.1 UDP-N-acetylmuramoyl-L-alanyl-D-glutamate--2,6-diaminopimelate ligase [Rhodocyclaceae bacterium]MBP6278624.1 UDP-N-acetylmuramoyl-L-alanyl-D-glutamate--2,6-diaminopimelate ligase [Rhodocyclaceae bacterium]
MSDAKSVLAELETAGVAVQSLCADSRRVRAGDVFVAMKGAQVDGRDYLAQAIENGAIGVIYERGKTPVGADGTPLVTASNIASFIGELASDVYGHPSQKLWLAGVTGTNGKTSVSQWIAQAMNGLDERCAVIGTLGNGFPDALMESANTTPDAITTQATLASFVNQKAQACAMEVSSIGLHQHRVDGIEFKVAILTNLSRDHLDYHGDMASYAKAKEALFLLPGLAVAVLNLDDYLGRELAAKLHGRVATIGYTLNDAIGDEIQCDQILVARNLSFHAAGLEFELDGQHINAPVVGRFNASNLLAVIGALLTRGHGLQNIAKVLTQIVAPPGRMQSIGGAGEPLVVVDYAHTPDALEKALSVLRETADSRAGKLHCVFGCGGARDAGKRPQMGAVAETFADRVVVTSDNPRNEDPEAIISDILKGMHGRPQVEIDRGLAITATISAASSQDVVLLAGKGHEPYQEINGVRLPFSDLQTAQLVLATRRQNGRMALEQRA